MFLKKDDKIRLNKKYMKYKNKLNKGSVRCIVFKENNIWHGVALELNIVEEGQDPVAVQASLYQAIKGYLKAAQKSKTSIAVLNQEPDKEYESLWNALEKRFIVGHAKEQKATIGGKRVFDFGYHTGAFASA